MKENNYFVELFHAIKTLVTGLGVTGREFFTPKITEQYPENREVLHISDRYRGALTMPHNEKNEHKCVACGLCQMACPNGTIKVESETYETADGKKKKRLLKYSYNLGSCMFCMLCVRACPHGAITFGGEFENAVFDRSKLVRQLNHAGSKVQEAARPVAKPVVEGDGK